jgi:hypothetical protein
VIFPSIVSILLPHHTEHCLHWQKDSVLHSYRRRFRCSRQTRRPRSAADRQQQWSQWTLYRGIRRHANGKYYVYDSLELLAAELNAAYLQRRRSPEECNNVVNTLLLLEIPRYAGYSTAAAGLHTLHDPLVLHDNMDSTSPWGHEGTLSVHTFETQARGFYVPLAVNKAVGSNLLSPQQ